MSVGVLLLAGILKSQTQIIKDTYLKFVNNALPIYKDIELVAEHTLYKHYRREEFLEKMYKKIKEKVK